VRVHEHREHDGVEEQMHRHDVAQRTGLQEDDRLQESERDGEHRPQAR
jgi:hypothetical protein